MSRSKERELEFKAFGSHYDVGYTIGRFHKEAAKPIFSKYFDDTIMKFYESPNGKIICTKFLENAEKHLPHIMEEMKGMAEGLGQEFLKVFLLHLQEEIQIVQRTKGQRYKNVLNLNVELEVESQSESENEDDEIAIEISSEDEVFDSGGCSTLYLKTSEACICVHNEDVMHEMIHTGAFVEAHVYPDPNASFKDTFYTFTVPGLLPGKGPSFNAHGLVTCSNSIFPRNLNASGIPTRIVQRSLITAKTIEEALEIASKKPGMSSGVSINLGHILGGQKDIINTELYATTQGTQYEKHKISNFDFHFNEYQHAQVFYLPDHTSQGRIISLRNILSLGGKPTSQVQILNAIAEDKEEDAFPLYRSGQYPDTHLTAVTVSFNLRTGWFEAYTSNPRISSPALTKNMMKFHR